jgi:hypothetical protein
MGIVGRRVSLNGRSSTPSGRVAFRWIQVDGPPIRTLVSGDDILMFLPEAAGVYRFALVVAADGRISEPDFATAVVFAKLPENGHAERGLARPVTPEEAAAVAANSIDDGPQAAVMLATAFEEIAGRMDLYETYADVLQGTSSRLESVLPSDAARRVVWNERLFIPLTKHLIGELRTAGLDLSQPGGLEVPLSATQRMRLVDHFQALARGFRSASSKGHRNRSLDPARLESEPLNTLGAPTGDVPGANGGVVP